MREKGSGRPRRREGSELSAKGQNTQHLTDNNTEDLKVGDNVHPLRSKKKRGRSRKEECKGFLASFIALCYSLRQTAVNVIGTGGGITCSEPRVSGARKRSMGEELLTHQGACWRGTEEVARESGERWQGEGEQSAKQQEKGARASKREREREKP